MSDKIEMTYEQAVSELEEIISKLESGEASLDDSIALYSRGMELSKFCKEKLDAIEKKISILSQDGANESAFGESV
ncbi:MAG: exodeoxyribonuclease VII small subunit [Saccharofermentanaceae bacterium]|jgi:exodeoxyribonuclease VII small subunit|nr:exodeoxyribonuclease VII small subunit [Saccharofermentanaceae bacterium]HAU51362.1 exodeoxyribonuclease VII small subunit [Clostridiales bacterium]